MNNENSPFFFLWKVSDWFSKWKGGDASFACQSFFILDSQVIQIFRLKNRLITLRAVTYMVREKMCFRYANYQSGNYWLANFFVIAAN